MEKDDSDDVLCRAFLNGDDEAFDTWVKRHQTFVFKLARRYCRNTEDARDLAQKAFLQAFEKARTTFKETPSETGAAMRALLGRITVNLGKNALRERHRWRWVHGGVDTAWEEPRGPQTLEKQQEKEALQQAIWTLPERQREVFLLRIDAELSFFEIAKALGIEESNAKAHFHLAVKRLKTLFSEVDRRRS